MLRREIRLRDAGRVRFEFVVSTAAICLAVLLAGCGQTMAGAQQPLIPAHATPTSTIRALATATPTTPPELTVVPTTGSPLAGTMLAWQHANLPSGFGMSFDQADLHVAASDGQTAYSCALPAGASSVQVVVTHDHGVTWTRVSDLPFVQPGGCQTISVDALNPDIVEVCCGDLNGYSAQAISTDGGTTWRLSGGQQTPLAIQFASSGSHTYSLLSFQQPSGVSIQLGVSDDGLRTWHVLDASLHDTNDRKLWVNPADGSLLLETWPDGGNQEIWQTQDNGEHWSKIPLPLPDVVDYAVQQPQAAGEPWRICGQFSNGGNGPDALVCTRDRGRTWTEEPALDQSGSFYAEQVVGMPADGSLLISAGLNASGSGRGVVYRLPAGAARWQSLGDVPTGSDGGCVYAHTGGGGALWTFPTESDGAGGYEATDAIYSAAYPY